MKIVFDSKEEMEKFCYNLSRITYCPEDFGFVDDGDHCRGGCLDCWKNAIDMEVQNYGLKDKMKWTAEYLQIQSDIYAAKNDAISYEKMKVLNEIIDGLNSILKGENE